MPYDNKFWNFIFIDIKKSILIVVIFADSIENILAVCFLPSFLIIIIGLCFFNYYIALFLLRFLTMLISLSMESNTFVNYQNGSC
ncbi:hypothetical protein [Butyrivibrio sp. VCD2006]|uniref:hypothetical protein n=1 Tax=Butyrivibrio sp. VCD2006 TaxID=1280664 RepID=UPI001FA77211|nr:hypothetical protein [Butyrivibrio sp. VCD2006]